VAVGSLVDAGSNLTGAWIVWKELLLKLVILCQYNSQIHRVPAGCIVTNKQTIRAWSANSKMVRYVLLRPRRPELDGQDVDHGPSTPFSRKQCVPKLSRRTVYFLADFCPVRGKIKSSY
jgi:hypothetical protein